MLSGSSVIPSGSKCKRKIQESPIQVLVNAFENSLHKQKNKLQNKFLTIALQCISVTPRYGATCCRHSNWPIMQQKLTPAAMQQLLGASEVFAHIRIYTMNHRQIDMNYKVYTVVIKYPKRFKTTCDAKYLSTHRPFFLSII